MANDNLQPYVFWNPDLTLFNPFKLYLGEVGLDDGIYKRMEKIPMERQGIISSGAFGFGPEEIHDDDEPLKRIEDELNRYNLKGVINPNLVFMPKDMFEGPMCKPKLFMKALKHTGYWENPGNVLYVAGDSSATAAAYLGLKTAFYGDLDDERRDQCSKRGITCIDRYDYETLDSFLGL